MTDKKPVAGVEKLLFNQWFKAQFGSLPDPQRLKKMRQQRFKLEAELMQTNMVLASLERLDDQYTAALYTRNAGPDFVFKKKRVK